MLVVLLGTNQNQQGALIIAPVTGELTTVGYYRWAPDGVMQSQKMYKRSEGHTVVIKYSELML